MAVSVARVTLFVMCLCVAVSMVASDTHSRFSKNPGVKRVIEIADGKTGEGVFLELRAKDDVVALERKLRDAFGADATDLNVAEVAMESHVPPSFEWCGQQLHHGMKHACEGKQERCDLAMELARDSTSVTEVVGTDGGWSSWAFLAPAVAPLFSVRTTPLDQTPAEADATRMDLYWAGTYCEWRIDTFDNDVVSQLLASSGTDTLFISADGAGKTGGLMQTLLSTGHHVRKYILVDIQGLEEKHAQDRTGDDDWLPLSGAKNAPAVSGYVGPRVELAEFVDHHREWIIKEERSGLTVLERAWRPESMPTRGFVPRLWGKVRLGQDAKLIDVQLDETVAAASQRTGETLALTPDDLALLRERLHNLERSMLEGAVLQAEEDIRVMRQALDYAADPTDGQADRHMLEGLGRSAVAMRLQKQQTQAEAQRSNSVLHLRLNHYHQVAASRAPPGAPLLAHVVYSVLASSQVPLTAVLQSMAELDRSIDDLHRLGLMSNPHRIKSWDMHRMIEAVIRVVAPHEEPAFLNMGAGSGDNLLLNLARLGYRRLYACELLASRNIHLHNRDTRIETSEQDMQQTNYKTHMFNVIASVSVIEHDVDVPRYFRESNRLLQEGGVLLTSCDYWPEKVDTSSVPLELNVFSREELVGEILNKDQLKRFGFKLVEHDGGQWGQNFDSNEKIVHFFGKRYTFAVFTLVKFAEIKRVLYSGELVTSPPSEAQLASLASLRARHPDAQIFALSTQPQGEHMGTGVFDKVDHITVVSALDDDTVKAVRDHFKVDVVDDQK